MSERRSDETAAAGGPEHEHRDDDERRDGDGLRDGDECRDDPAYDDEHRDDDDPARDDEHRDESAHDDEHRDGDDPAHEDRPVTDGGTAPAGTSATGRWFDVSGTVGRRLVGGVVVLLVVFLIGPVVVTVVSSFAQSAAGVVPTGFVTLDHWRKVLGFGEFGVRRPIWADLLFSMRLATAGMLLNLAVGVPVAYAVTRYEFFGRDLLNTLAILPLVPGVVLGLAFLRAYPTTASSWFGLVTGYALLKSPFMVLTVQSSFQSMSLRQLEESARSLGASWPRAFLTVIVPNAKRGIVAGCVITWLLAAAEFNFTYMVYGNGPRPFALFLFQNLNNATFLQSAAAISVYFCLVVGAIVVLQLLGNAGFSTQKR